MIKEYYHKMMNYKKPEVPYIMSHSGKIMYPLCTFYAVINSLVSL